MQRFRFALHWLAHKSFVCRTRRSRARAKGTARSLRAIRTQVSLHSEKESGMLEGMVTFAVGLRWFGRILTWTLRYIAENQVDSTTRLR
jgi:hypothetical protein